MPAALVECIPNFSDARRPEVIEKIRQSIAAVPGVEILDQHSDLEHNRTVITFIGPPAAVEEAAFQSIATAAALIDLNHHTGAHPRIGAADVVPFVPIRNMTMEECVDLSRRLGRRVGDDLRIPVYLYEESATSPERRQLENIRRGEYEYLKKEILTNPHRKPDFGPAELGPAGATVIGARHPLIACNVILDTGDISAAQKIAQAVRHTSGGLQNVKASGALVDGRAQLTLNLTNFQDTPIFRVIEMIRSEAAHMGTIIHHCELIGLVPQDVLIQSAAWYLQLVGFEPGQILENRLSQPGSGTEGIPVNFRYSFLEDLASSSPTPAGGSAAAFTGALTASLAVMIGRVTVGKGKYAGVKREMEEIIEKGLRSLETLQRDIERDSAAYTRFLEALRLPGETPGQQADRSRALQNAALHSARVPIDTARHTLEAMRLALEAGRVGNKNTVSDAGSAVILGRASIACSLLNARTNLKNLEDPQSALSVFKEINEIEAAADIVYRDMNEIIRERSGLSLPL